MVVVGGQKNRDREMYTCVQNYNMSIYNIN